MATLVDARGLACPQPVILTRRAMREFDDVVTIVDQETSRHNVSRMAEKQGYRVESEVREDGIYIHLVRVADTTPAPAAEPPTVDRQIAGARTVLLLASEQLGRGEHVELGQILARSLFHVLAETDAPPSTIILLNSGVKLAVEGSPVLADLLTLAERGVEVLACGTCLDYYGLKERLRVGNISNMYTIAEALLEASKVIAP
jgi:selenium metabolism protein YedF